MLFSYNRDRDLRGLKEYRLSETLKGQLREMVFRLIQTYIR